MRSLVGRTHVSRRIALGATSLMLAITLVTAQAFISPNALCLPLAIAEEKSDISLAVFEAENGVTLGNASIASSMGVEFVQNITQDGDGVSIRISVPADGHYDISVSLASVDGGYKENYLAVDNERIGVVSAESKAFTSSVLRRAYMSAGEHEVSITKFWGWVKIDSVSLTPSKPIHDSLYDVPPALINPNASDNARRLMTYLCDIYGTLVLSGQQCDEGMYGTENACIWRATGGLYPAVLGLDLIDYSPSRVNHGTASKAVEYAIEYWQKGGIVALCWHWNAPDNYLTGKWYSGFYTEHTNIDLAAIMDGRDPRGYELLVSDIDAIAVELTRIRDAGVPVLWRPLHEASGTWFWWGAAGADAYKALYRLLYERLTNEYELNNLIWVWNGQARDWYPGDEYVDIIGEDVYPGEHVHTSQAERFLSACEYTDVPKLIALSENGCLPDPDQLLRDGIMWSYFCTWGGDFMADAKGFNFLSEKYTSEDMVKKVFSHEAVITRDELPDISAYPLRESK